MAFIFTLLWYFLVIALVLLALGAVGAVYITLTANDFPRKRRYCRKDIKLNGKTAIVTGANSGIGFETAKGLAERGARVIMACRNLTKAEAARQKIVGTTGNNNVIVMHCNLSDLESVQTFSKEFLAKEKDLHILINNAGALASEVPTKQNIQGLAAANYFGPFLLTYLLLDRLKESSPSRIVNVSSASHYETKGLNLVDLEENGVKFKNWNEYGETKLLNVLHAKELARRLEGSNVTTYALHPGLIFTPIMDELKAKSAFYSTIMKLLKIFAIDEYQGSQTSLFCAIDPSVETSSGKYYDNCREKQPNKIALDADLARRVWEISLETVSSFTKLA